MKNLFNKNFSPCEKKSKAQTFPLAEKFATPPIRSHSKGVKNLLIKLLAEAQKVWLHSQGSQKPFDQTFGEAKKFGRSPKKFGSINRRKDKLQI